MAPCPPSRAPSRAPAPEALPAPARPARPAPSPTASERRFYAGTRAIGRFGMRSFTPSLMPSPHWHGHVEANFLTGAAMTYAVEDQEVEVPPDRLTLFWAGVPHQLVRLTQTGEATPRLTNLYLPLDLFLFMTHVQPLQMALLAGGIACLDPGLADAGRVETWFRDYRSGRPERRDVLTMELNATLRRALLDPLDYLRPPSADALADPAGAQRPRAARTAHAVAMVRFIMENLSEPVSNADVAAVTGLHETYAMSLFASVLGTPMHRFLIRMRLLRARALLLESNATVASVALRAGFPSLSQFHDHFRRAYGTTPQAFRTGRSPP